MSGSGDPGRREVAHRVFAAAFEDATVSYSESDEERAPNYVVTPAGARLNRVFVVGVLTEIEAVDEDYLRARVVDPTGAFVVYAGQYQPEALAFFEDAETPAFVAVTGKARTFQPDGSDRIYTSIRPESVNAVDADTRDRWVVDAAEHTVARVARMAEAKATGQSGEALEATLRANGVPDSLAAGVPIALAEYGTTGTYLQALRDTALDAARVVSGDVQEAETIAVAPADGDDGPIGDLVERDLDVVDPDKASGATAEEPSAPESTEETTTATASGEPAGSATATSEADETVADATESAPEADDPAETSTTTDVDAEPAEATETEATDDEAAEAATEDARAEPAAAEADADEGDLEDFDADYDLDEDEREEIEDEYGTEFQTGTDVEEPGEADIDTPDDLPEADDAGDATPDSDDGKSDGDTDDAEPDAAQDLEDAVMDAMAELDDGDGADRDAVQGAVVERTGADAADVEDAIQEALMGGRCYEPDDATLKPI